MVRLLFLIPFITLSFACGSIFSNPVPGRCNYAAAPFGGGSGTLDDPYTICTVAHLMQVQNYLTSSFKQYADLDLAGNTTFTPIGSSATPFTGNYDGGGRKISNWTYSDSSDSHWPLSGEGLFARLSGTVQNLQLDNFQVTGNLLAGVIAGTMSNSFLTNIVITNSNVGIFSTGGQVGALAGIAVSVIATNVVSSASVQDVAGSSINRTGGLFGQGANLTLARNHVTGNVTCVKSTGRCGGFIGETYGNINISQSYYSGGSIIGTLGAGGLISLAATAGTVSISDSYVTGTIQGGSSGSSKTGGILGVSNRPVTLTNVFVAGAVSGGSGVSGGLVGSITGNTVISTSSYWDIGITGQVTSADTGSTGTSTSAMQSQSTFTGWDFTTVWNSPSSGAYPTLR